MSLFKSKKTPPTPPVTGPIQSAMAPQPISPVGPASLAETVLAAIHDGVIMIDSAGVVRYINPAAATMAGLSAPDVAIGLDIALIVRLADQDGRALADADNPLIRAIRANQPVESCDCRLIVGQTDKQIPICFSVFSSASGDRVVTFRNIEKELAEESEQAEFISTASHEMRTPVASIEGYLSLALNPQTATIDDRAKGYLEAAHSASQHLGRLFRDLLDTTKLDDGHIRPEFAPVEMTELVSGIIGSYAPQATKANIRLVFGSDAADPRRLAQPVYSYVDPNFMREILDNLIDNALKYTAAGGSVFVNVRGEDKRVLVTVRDTGMGISASDLGHIFQKFYRADNSDTRTIGGTGLGLYLVKQRVEAMGGNVWAESVFGEGSCFYVALPRISAEEYEKRMISVYNNLNGGNK